MHIRFNDPQNQWDVWQPKVGDEISVSYGSIGTGKMFVDSTAAKNGLYTIVAASIPPSAKEGKSKAWQKNFPDPDRKRNCWKSWLVIPKLWRFGCAVRLYPANQ